LFKKLEQKNERINKNTRVSLEEILEVLKENDIEFKQRSSTVKDSIPHFKRNRIIIKDKNIKI